MKQMHDNRSKQKRAGREFKYILVTLKCLGIDIFPKKVRTISCCKIFFHYLIPAIYHLYFVERSLHMISLLLILPASIKVLFSQLVNNVLNMLLWYAFYIRRKPLKQLLVRLFQLAVNLPPGKKNKRSCFLVFIHLMLALICILPIPYGIGELCTLWPIRNLRFYFIKADKTSTFQVGFMLVRGVMNSVRRDTFCGTVCLLYSLVCWQISQNLASHRKLWCRVQSEKGIIIPYRDIFSRYTLILNLIEDINLHFSCPIFILTVINGVSLFSLMAFVFRGRSMTAFNFLQVSVILATSAIFLTVTVSMGSQIYLEVQKNVDYLNRFQEKIMRAPSNYGLDVKEVKLLELVKRRPVRILNGCHVLYFRRGLLLATVGTLLTYGLLIINYN